MTRTADFWSRRKAGVEAEARAEAQAAEAARTATAQAALEERTDAEILAELDLPDPDSLQQGDDFTVFLKAAIPERLRRRALRRLWLSNPALANLDALVDYGEDYTDAATVIENMQTAYQVGKGMLHHVEEMARQDAARDNPPAPAAQEPVEEPQLSLVADDDSPLPQDDPDANTGAEAPQPLQADPAPVPRRRMRFDFAAATAPTPLSEDHV